MFILSFSIENLLAAVINPELNPLTGKVDLITLYMEKEGQDCQAGLLFGMDIQQILKKARKVIGTYDLTLYMILKFLSILKPQKLLQNLLWA